MVWNKLYKYSFLKEKNLTFIEGIIHEDEEFTFKCYMASSKVRYINKFLYNYRINREDSIMNTINKNKKISYSIKSLEKIIENLKILEDKEENYFIKIRIFLRKMELKNLIFEKNKRIISKNEILNFENKLKKIKLNNLNEKEKEIIKNKLRDIILKREFQNINLLNKFYWENNILYVTDLRKIISRKLRKIFLTL